MNIMYVGVHTCFHTNKSHVTWTLTICRCVSKKNYAYFILFIDFGKNFWYNNGTWWSWFATFFKCVHSRSRSLEPEMEKCKSSKFNISENIFVLTYRKLVLSIRDKVVENGVLCSSFPTWPQTRAKNFYFGC